MKTLKVKIIAVLASDEKALTAVQQKLNQWMTTGMLKKYEMQTSAEHVIFNICLHKEPVTVDSIAKKF